MPPSAASDVFGFLPLSFASPLILTALLALPVLVLVALAARAQRAKIE